jgi:hypothetical protein
MKIAREATYPEFPEEVLLFLREAFLEGNPGMVCRFGYYSIRINL